MVFKEICTLICIAAIVQASVFSKCDRDPEAVSVQVKNCNENDQYCEVKRGVPSHMEVTFKPTKEATNLSSSVHAQVAGMWTPWSLGAASKVCNNLKKGACPVAGNSEATYAFGIKIPIIAPVGLKTVVQLKIVDQNKSVVACSRFSVLVAA